MLNAISIGGMGTVPPIETRIEASEIVLKKNTSQIGNVDLYNTTYRR
jgi:ethanolamine utilization microcompartment shell protein EutS